MSVCRFLKTGVAALLGAVWAVPALAACAEQNLDGKGYWVCSFSPTETRIEMHLKDGQGHYFHTLGNFIRTRQAENQQEPLFAMNAGMYHPDWRPVGLYVEKGEQIAPLVKGRGSGNFFIQPNGVFFVRNGKAGIATTSRYAAQPKSDYATQSGPMLVVDGTINRRFVQDSTSCKIRNGVGVRRDGSVVMIVARERVNFYEFAQAFMRNNARNALYLDGTVSSFYSRGKGLDAGFMPLGPIVAVYAAGK